MCFSPRCPGFYSRHSQDFIFDLGVAEIYQRHWFEESGQRLDNLAVTHIGQKLCAKINRYHQFYEGNIWLLKMDMQLNLSIVHLTYLSSDLGAAI